MSLLRRRMMLRSIINSIIGFIPGNYSQISVDANGVFTLENFNAWIVYTVPFSRSINVHTGDVVTFRLNSAYGNLSGQFCDGGFYLPGAGINSPQLRVFKNRNPETNIDYTATANTDFTATHWGLAVRNSSYNYNGRLIKPEIFINGVQIV